MHVVCQKSQGEKAPIEICGANFLQRRRNFYRGGERFRHRRICRIASRIRVSIGMSGSRFEQLYPCPGLLRSTDRRSKPTGFKTETDVIGDPDAIGAT